MNIISHNIIKVWNLFDIYYYNKLHDIIGELVDRNKLYPTFINHNDTCWGYSSSVLERHSIQLYPTYSYICVTGSYTNNIQLRCVINDLWSPMKSVTMLLFRLVKLYKQMDVTLSGWNLDNCMVHAWLILMHVSMGELFHYGSMFKMKPVIVS